MICEEKFSRERFDEKNAASKPTGPKKSAEFKSTEVGILVILEKGMCK